MLGTKLLLLSCVAYVSGQGVSYYGGSNVRVQNRIPPRPLGPYRPPNGAEIRPLYSPQPVYNPQPVYQPPTQPDQPVSQPINQQPQEIQPVVPQPNYPARRPPQLTIGPPNAPVYDTTPVPAPEIPSQRVPLQPRPWPVNNYPRPGPAWSWRQPTLAPPNAIETTPRENTQVDYPESTTAPPSHDIGSVDVEPPISNEPEVLLKPEEDINVKPIPLPLPKPESIAPRPTTAPIDSTLLPIPQTPEQLKPEAVINKPTEPIEEDNQSLTYPPPPLQPPAPIHTVPKPLLPLPQPIETPVSNPITVPKPIHLDLIPVKPETPESDNSPNQPMEPLVPDNQYPTYLPPRPISRPLEPPQIIYSPLEPPAPIQAVPKPLPPKPTQPPAPGPEYQTPPTYLPPRPISRPLEPPQIIYPPLQPPAPVQAVPKPLPPKPTQPPAPSPIPPVSGQIPVYPPPVVTIPGQNIQQPRPSYPTPAPVSVIPLADFQCTRGNAYYAVINECDAYIECQNQKAWKHTCPDGLNFNPNALHPEYPCAYPSEVQCTSTATKQNPNPTSDCPNRYGFFSMAGGDCSKYIMCQEGLATVMNCPFGLVFNDRLSSCDWPENVPQCNLNAFKDFTCPMPPEDDPDRLSKLRYGNHCKMYVACQRGHPRLLQCASGMSFDENSQVCIDTDLVKDCQETRY